VPIRTYSWLLVIVFLLCLFEARLQAQDTSCLAYPQCQSSNQWVGGCAPLLPLGVFNCGSFGWSESCEIKTYKCTRPPCPICCSKGPATPATCGSPINLSSGNTFISQSDLSVPGLGGGLAVSRTWNSLNSGIQGLFGPGWRSTYEESVYLGDDGFMKYSRADGAIWTFGFATQSPLVYLIMTPASASASLLFDGTTWTLIFQNNEKRTFSGATGKLLSIIDRNGNTTLVSYDTSNRLASVADPAGRHLVFAYSGNGGLVMGVTSDVGVATTYAYDNFGRLAQVTKPDLSTVSFQYDTNSRIAAVLDSQGKLLESHTYDSSGRGLTSSRALGVDALTVSYP
jgi:YD repeat-containing protein